MEILRALFVGAVIMIILLPFEFLSAMIGSLWLMLFFNLSGVAVLAGLGYWTLVWLFMAGMTVVSSGAAYAKIGADAAA